MIHGRESLRKVDVLNRFLLALRVFWAILTKDDVAQRAEQIDAPPAEGPDLRVLAVLQRDGRLVDFLLEDIDGYTDAQIGAAVRDIHRGCRKVLTEYLSIEPIQTEPEGSTVSVPPGFDPNAIRLSGNVAGLPPFRGALRHPGWRVKSVQLPVLPGAQDHSSILAPAEIEIP